MSQAGIVDFIGTHPEVPILFVANIGSAVPITNTLEILGEAVVAQSIPIQTVASGNTLEVQIQFASAASSSIANNAGLASFNSADFNVDANGYVSIANFSPFVYTNVTYAQSPYTVLATDFYISVDCSGGVVSLLFPNTTTQFRRWIVKDRTGSSSTFNISLTTVGGSVTIDGQTTYKINSNEASVQLLWNGTSYEVY